MRPGHLLWTPPVETATARCPSESRATAPTVSPSKPCCWRSLSMMKTDGSHVSTPCERAKRDAPSPDSSTCLPSFITSTARSIGWRTSRTAPTPPARSSAPSITPASSSTSPSRFRQAPMPALSSGSSSSWRTAATAAAKAPEPITAQPAASARSTAAWRSGRSATGTGPAPPWTISAGLATAGLWARIRGAPERGVPLSAGRKEKGFGGRRWHGPDPVSRRPGARRLNAVRRLASRIPWVPKFRCSTSHPHFESSSALHARALGCGRWHPGRISTASHYLLTRPPLLMVERAQLLVHAPLRPPALQLVPRTHVDELGVARQARVDLADEAKHLLGDPAIVRVALGRRPQLAQVVDLAQVDSEVPADVEGERHDVLRQRRPGVALHPTWAAAAASIADRTRPSIPSSARPPGTS